LWLNEGFATWIEYLCMNHCEPHLNIWNYHATDHLLRALELDSLASSHPIEINVNDPSEINEIFDSISYCKGSCVIRMLLHYIGEESFINGLRSYLKMYQYKNARTGDLWNELERASGKPIKQLMLDWTNRAGYPLVEVCCVCFVAINIQNKMFNELYL
jgi:aminopeptidase N